MNDKLKKEYNFLEGEVLLFDKPLKWTSFDLVRKIRASIKRKYNIKKIKVGHAGTLDPLATGLLIICTGKMTKQINGLTGQDKEYIADIKLGATRASFDRETPIEQEFPIEHINKELIEEKLQLFLGEIDQIPPQYSAKKIDGNRAYKMARNGENPEMKVHRVTIYELEILSFDLPDLKLKIKCGKGTYIRSLAHDLGKALNSGAYLNDLRRTKIGDYSVDDALTVNNFREIIGDSTIK